MLNFEPRIWSVSESRVQRSEGLLYHVFIHVLFLDGLSNLKLAKSWQYLHLAVIIILGFKQQVW